MQESMKAFSGVQKILYDDAKPAFYLSHGGTFKTHNELENEENNDQY